MAGDGKPTSKAQYITFAAVVLVLGGLWAFKTFFPEKFAKSGLKSVVDGIGREERDDEFVHCELKADKVYDLEEATETASSRYDYTFTCSAKKG